MVDSNKYLERLDKIEDLSKKSEDKRKEELRNQNYRDMRARYKGFRREAEEQQKAYYFHSKIGEILDNPNTSNEQISAYAHLLMEDALKTSRSKGIGGIDSGVPMDFKYAMKSAQMYERIGKGRKVIPKLLGVVERDAEKGYPLDARDIEKVKAFIERNTKREPKSGGLERQMVFIGSVLAGIIISAFSIKATGNVIGNLTGTTTGLLGLILFVFGIAGLFFGSGKK